MQENNQNILALKSMYKCSLPVKIKRMIKSLPLMKNKQMLKSLRPVKIRPSVKSLRPVKIRRIVKSFLALKSPRLVKYQRSQKSWRNWKSWQPAYCLGSVESPTADFSQVPLMSTFSSSLMWWISHVVSKWGGSSCHNAFMGGLSPYCTSCL